MTKKTTAHSRRGFLKKLTGSTFLLASGLSAAGSPYSQSKVLSRKDQKVSANDRIRVGVIGAGIMGHNNLRTALSTERVELAGMCDLYQGHLLRGKELFGTDLYTTTDYEALLGRSDIDAVIVATSDHWHDKIAIAAMEAGKAVYCEKPMVHHWDEGQAVIDAEKRTGAKVIVGSQRVSSIVYEKAADLYRAGEIGQLVLAEAWYDRQSALGAWQYSIPTDASPQTIDWERFQGDAPKHEFDPMRFFRWRNYQAYGTGVAGDLFVHLFSGLHVITGSLGPERVYATGGLRYWKDGRDVPDVMLALYDYPQTESHPAFNLQMRVNFVDGGGGGQKIRLVGTEGIMEVGYNGVKIIQSKMPEQPGYGGWDTFFTFTESQQEAYEAWYRETYPDPEPTMRAPREKEYLAPEGYSDSVDHWTNFLDAIQHGGSIVEDPTFGLRAAGPALLTNLSYFEQKEVRWDPMQMKVV